jgi:hypothetical protein
LARIELSTGTKVNDRRRILDLKGISKASPERARWLT